MHNHLWYSSELNASSSKTSPLRNKSSSIYNGSPEINRSYTPVEDSYRLIEGRLRDQEFQNERTLSQLRSEITRLRVQIDTVNSDHQLELQKIRSEHDEKLFSLHSSHESELNDLRRHVDELQHTASVRKAENEREREIISKESRFLEDENASLRFKAQDLSKDIQNIQTNIIEPTKSQINAINRENKFSSDRAMKTINDMEQQHRFFVKDIHQNIAMKENEAKRLNSNLNLLKREILEKNNNAQDEIKKLETIFCQKKIVLENCKNENEKLKETRDQIKQHTQTLMTETQLLQLDARKMRRENDELAETIKKLNKIVYGKNNPT